MSFPKPRIYLMGGCAAYPDLGIEWRLEADVVIEKHGGVAVWPPDIEMAGHQIKAGIKPDLEMVMHNFNVTLPYSSRIDSLQALYTSHAIFHFSEKSGKGTAAEMAFNAWLPKPRPIVQVLHREHFYRMAEEAVGLGRRFRAT